MNDLYEEDKDTGGTTKEIRKFVYMGDTKVASVTSDTSQTPPLEMAAFHHADHLGSSNVTTDSSGNVIEVADYYPYGKSRIEEKGAGYTNDYLFTGKELDRPSGLYYYGARYYDPLIGRFTGLTPCLRQAEKNPEKTHQTFW